MTVTYECDFYFLLITCAISLYAKVVRVVTMSENIDDELATAVENGFLNNSENEDGDSIFDGEPEYRRMTREEAMAVGNSDDEE